MRVNTVSLYVRERVLGAKDRLGNAVTAYKDPIRVDGCLFAPTGAQDLGEERPNGAKCAYVAHFPKSATVNLAGALVSYDQKTWMHVVGEPMEFPHNCVKTPWATKIVLEVVNG